MFRQFSKSKLSQRSFRTHWVVACLLVSILLGLTGVPAPISKSSSERFPCENSPCGCVSAAHCWDKCCCHTDEEKLAWAEANHVKPPPFLVARVASSRRTQQFVSKKPKPACCANRQPAKVSSKTETPSNCQSCSRIKKGAQAPVRQARSVEIKLVLADPFLECHGSGSLWKLLSSNYLPSKPAALCDPVEYLAETRPILDSRAFSLADPPDGPVPKWV